MSRYGLFLCLLLASCTGAIPHQKAGFVVHEKRVDHPAWTNVRRLERDVPIPLRIGLKQQNLDKLPEFLMAVSDPTSSLFGLHWSPEKVAKVFAPATRAIDAVNTWLIDAGFDTQRLRSSHNTAWIEVQNATVEEVERLLGAEYYVYSHQATSKEHVGRRKFF
jgi:tripeptidyl-peptidase-1